MTIIRKKSLKSGIIPVVFLLLATFLSTTNLRAQGGWIYKNASDTTRIYCLSDTMGWLAFPPGCMQGGHGMMFPDSIYCIYQKMELDSLPGNMDSTFCEGYHIDVFNSSSHTGDGMMGQNMMSFNQPICLRIHYDLSNIEQKGWSESGIALRYWDKNQLLWNVISGASLDTLENTIEIPQNPLYSYYLLSSSTPASVPDESRSSASPITFELYQNYPNPFNPITTIQFKIESLGSKDRIHTNLSIFNIVGQRIRTLLNADKLAGEYQVVWNGKDDAGNPVSSGIYFYRLESGNLTSVRKMFLMK